jgi:hypothetical protein
VDANIVTELDVMLDYRVSTHADVVANLIQLADHDPVAGLKISADPVAGVDHAVRPDDERRGRCGWASSPAALPRGGVPTIAKSATLLPGAKMGIIIQNSRLGNKVVHRSS